MKIQLKRATLDDADAMGRIGALGWQAAYRGIVPDDVLDNITPDARAQRFRQAYQAFPEAMYWLVLSDGVEAGLINAHPCMDDDARDCGEIGAIYFLPEYCRQGLGSAAMAHALQALREMGFSQAVLWVLEQNSRARRFYEKQGFAADGAARTLHIGRDLAEVRYRRSI